MRKLAGVPQNRPRFVLIGIRKDVFDILTPTFNEAEQALFAQPLAFSIVVNTVKN